MKMISVILASSLSLVTLIIGFAGGYYLSPIYQQTMYTKETMDFGPADYFLDFRYLNAMATHHEGAILLANQVAGASSRKEIQELAQEIQKNEPELIQKLSRLKKEWYSDERGAPKPVVANLGEADDTFDLRFLNALIAHHEAGIEMTKEIRTKSSRSEILNDADAVENFLSGTKEMLKKWRQDWYQVQ